MAKWMLRRLVWMTGVSFEHMKRTLRDTNVDLEDDDGESIPVGLDDGESIPVGLEEGEWL
jgi:hypothetical protein